MASVVENRRPLFFVDLRFVDLWGGRGRPPGQPARRRRYSIVLASTLFHSFGVTMLRSVVLAFLLFCTISAHAAEAPWIRVSSSHFSVLTDAGEKRGREVILRFEQMRAVFAQLLMKTRVRMPEPLEIIAVKSDKEYVQLAPFVHNQPISAPGFFLAGDDRNYIVLDLFADDSWRAISHQFAHLLLNYNYPPTPGWFDEGFAEYFSSLRLADKQAQNQKMPVEQAIQQAYGMSSSQLEQAVKDYFRSLAPLFQAEDAANRPGTINASGEIYQFSVVGPEEIGASVQPVSEADAQAFLAEAALRLPEHREQAAKELQSIIGQPKLENAVAHRALAWDHMEKKEFDQATEELDKATELDGRDPWLHYYKALVKYRQREGTGESFRGLANMIQDLRAVLDWDPDFAEAYTLLAMARLEGGGIRSALEAIKTATQLSPRNQTYLLNMARVYMAANPWDAAAALTETLKTSQNSQIAQAAKKNLENLPTLKKYGVLPQPEATSAPPKPPDAPKHSKQETADTGEEPSSEHELRGPAASQIDKRKVQFLKGKLVSVDCAQEPIAVLTVVAGKKTLKLRSEDYKSITMIGADEFSCDWKDRSVAINYRAGGKADGDVVSLKIQ